MPRRSNENNSNYRIRAKLPQYLRFAAIGALGVAVLVVVVGFYRERSKASFRLSGEHAQLSKDVVAEVNGYERLETENGVNKYYIRADYAKTFSDEHQEFTNVYVEVFDAAGSQTSKMTAAEAIYIPEPNTNFTAYLKGDVEIETAEELKIATEQLTYTRGTDTAETEDEIGFEGRGLKGRSIGATVRIGDKRVDLLRDVVIEAFESPELMRSNVRYARMASGSAMLDHGIGKVALDGSVTINIESGAQPTQRTELSSLRANAELDSKETSLQIKRFELFENVHITSTTGGQPPTNIAAGYASYDRAADRFELKNGAHIVADAGGKPTDIRAGEAVLERTAGKLALTGSAEITQGSDYLKGDSLFANLFPDNKVKDAVIRGNAYARQITAERTTSVTAPELNAFFNAARMLERANAIGSSTAELIPNANTEYSRVTLTAARGIGLAFKGAGLLDAMRTDGRTSIDLNVPNNQPDSANKRVTADAVKTIFAANGRDLARAEAVGNAELIVTPLNTGAERYRTTVTAPRFDCDFFPGTNDARECTGRSKARVVRTPTVQARDRGEQTVTSDLVTARFSAATRDIESLAATGSAKFTELDRTAIARQMVFTQADQVVRLRGGEPIAWDSRARARATEIDWHTRQNRSYLRGGVSTTYYSQRQTKGATPFAASDRPVYATADQGEFDHVAETAQYSGNARAWQDDNYVRGNKLFIDQANGRIFVEGNVQSLIYNARVKGRAKDSTVPVSASAATLAYDRSTRLLQYRNNVDIRQGTDRLVANSADVQLDENNEMSSTVAESNVVITQPGRRATGDWARFTAADEVAVLRGDPATVFDAQNGATQGGELTISIRDSRVTAEGKTKQNASARIRTVYKTRPN